MTDYEKLEEEYRRKKIEYLKNKPADNRYVMHDIGEGFVIQDKLAHMNHEHENDYMLLNNMFGEERKVQEGYKTKEIASMLKINESTIRSQLLKARTLLKQELGGIYAGE